MALFWSAPSWGGKADAGIFLQVPKGRRDGLPAHIVSLAQRAYWALLSQRRDQSIVALGRSGAGKTTCCKQVLEHLVGMAGSVDGSVSGTVGSGGHGCHGAGLWGRREAWRGCRATLPHIHSPRIHSA